MPSKGGGRDYNGSDGLRSFYISQCLKFSVEQAALRFLRFIAELPPDCAWPGKATGKKPSGERKVLGSG